MQTYYQPFWKTKNLLQNYMESNLNYEKSTRIGVKTTRSIVTVKNVSSTGPRTFSHGENIITNPLEIDNAFNNYSASVPDTAKQNIKYSHKHFSEYLKHKFIIYPTNRQTVRE